MGRNFSTNINRRALLAALAAFALMVAPLLPVSALAQTPSATDPLPSWNEGEAKAAIFDFRVPDHEGGRSLTRLVPANIPTVHSVGAAQPAGSNRSTIDA